MEEERVVKNATEGIQEDISGDFIGSLEKRERCRVDVKTEKSNWKRFRKITQEKKGRISSVEVLESTMELDTEGTADTGGPEDTGGTGDIEHFTGGRDKVVLGP